MKALSKWIAIGGAVWCSMTALATDLTIHLAGNGLIARRTVTFQCDAEGVKLGLPARPFPVIYLNGAGNSLAVLPIEGSSLIFASVISGSEARCGMRGIGVSICTPTRRRGTQKSLARE